MRHSSEAGDPRPDIEPSSSDTRGTGPPVSGLFHTGTGYSGVKRFFTVLPVLPVSDAKSFRLVLTWMNFFFKDELTRNQLRGAGLW